MSDFVKFKSDEAGGYEIGNYRVKPLSEKNQYYSAAFCPVFHIHESERGLNLFFGRLTTRYDILTIKYMCLNVFIQIINNILNYASSDTVRVVQQL